VASLTSRDRASVAAIGKLRFADIVGEEWARISPRGAPAATDVASGLGRGWPLLAPGARAGYDLVAAIPP
jgi:hypothetical protein